MKFQLTKPCDQCPFRRGTPIRLTEARVHEIASQMLSTQGGTFPCHKTIDYDKYEDDGDLNPNSCHCVGALVFAEKHGNATQYMRIAERLGLYNAATLLTKENQRLVFDTLEQMSQEIGLGNDEDRKRSTPSSSGKRNSALKTVRRKSARARSKAATRRR